MITLNIEDFSDEYKEVAPKECAAYLSSCLPENVRKQLKKEWNELGGYHVMPYWEYVINTLSIKYDGPDKAREMIENRNEENYER